MRWKSSVLRTFMEPEHCRVCAFIAGSRSTTDMLEVIRILDLELAESEETVDRLSRAFQKLIDRNETQG